MNRMRISVVAVAAVLAAGCTSIPTGPSTMALPGTGKPFDQFRADDLGCRQYANEAIGGQTTANAQQESGVKSAVAGAAIGALIGAAVGGGHGAAVGAGVGGGAGAIAGVGAADTSGYEVQRRYDQAYTQCMYGKGHRVAVNGRFSPGYYPQASAPASPAYYPPPARYSTAPPSGSAPPPGSAPGPTASAGFPPPPPPGSPPPNPAWIR
jgi:hypothetical protein